MSQSNILLALLSGGTATAVLAGLARYIRRELRTVIKDEVTPQFEEQNRVIGRIDVRVARLEGYRNGQSAGYPQ